MIRWDPAGEHIIVERPEQLALHVLPSIYRQSRFASFSRQLNVRASVSLGFVPKFITSYYNRSMALCARLTFVTSIPLSMIPTPALGVSAVTLSPVIIVGLILFLFSSSHIEPSFSPRGRRQLQASCSSSFT